jgi:hypothetical protein
MTSLGWAEFAADWRLLSPCYCGGIEFDLLDVI